MTLPLIKKKHKHESAFNLQDSLSTFQVLPKFRTAAKELQQYGRVYL